MSSKRSDGRNFDELRPVKITRNYLKYPEGSVLIEQGETKIIVNASVEPKVPRWMKDTNNSWITAEYNMLPRATDRRNSRDRNGRHTPGRSIEIQRLIGRSIRAAFGLEGIGECAVVVDCDVIQADGGTRCASITGGIVAAYDAMKFAFENGYISKMPDFKFTAAISVGILQGKPLLDLYYQEDSKAGVDTNFVMNEDMNIIEIQGTSERETFNQEQLLELMKLAQKGIKELIEEQKKALNI